MQIFIGSSSQARKHLDQIAVWLENLRHKPMPWTDHPAFFAGQSLFNSIIRAAHESDGAIFIFSEDDHAESQSEQVFLPRDNVLIECGLFVGILGPDKVIICRVGNAKIASDLGGILYVNMDKKFTAKAELRRWLRNISPPPSLPRSRKSIEIEILEKLSINNQDPNLDFLIAVAEENEAKAQAAVNAGADQSIELASIIMKYGNQIDQKLQAELMRSYDNPQPSM